MRKENDLSNQDILHAINHGGTDGADPGTLFPLNTPYYDKPDHLERSTHHSPNHRPHLQRNNEVVLGEPIYYENKDFNFILRRRNSRKPR
jgi:hypothetical protein